MAEFIKDETEFNILLKNTNILVVDCTATWCGPCKLVSPLIDQLAEEYSDQAQVYKLDVNPNKSVIKRFGITSIPAVLFFKEGRWMDTLVGIKSYEEFSSVLTRLLS